MKNVVRVTRDKPGLGHSRSYLLIRAAFTSALTVEKVGESCEINVLLTDDEGIRAINRDNRGVDAATDVLSFPFNNLTPGAFDADECERDMDTDCVYLGDMAINLPRCAKQAEEFGHDYERELMYLTVHSTLHLLGYDHMDEGEDKALMRTREKKIMLLLTGRE